MRADLAMVQTVVVQTWAVVHSMVVVALWVLLLVAEDSNRIPYKIPKRLTLHDVSLFGIL